MDTGAFSLIYLEILNSLFASWNFLWFTRWDGTHPYLGEDLMHHGL